MSETVPCVKQTLSKRRAKKAPTERLWAEMWEGLIRERPITRMLVGGLVGLLGGIGCDVTKLINSSDKYYLS